MSVRGYVLIEAEVGKAKAVGEAVTALEHKDAKVVSVDTVTGPFDVIVQLEADDLISWATPSPTASSEWRESSARPPAPCVKLARPAPAARLLLRRAGKPGLRDSRLGQTGSGPPASSSSFRRMILTRPALLCGQVVSLFGIGLHVEELDVRPIVP
jgi:hypothetical protein